MIRQGLDGQRVLITGATGFVGQALLERLLAECPGTDVTLLVRPRGSESADDRVRGLLAAPVFSPLRERIGDGALEDLAAARVSVLQGGVDDPPKLPSDLDVIVHCAATVSFDPPIDEAFTTNLFGALSLYRAALGMERPPHLVHVSTAYVAGIRQGHIHERPLDHDVDWRTEADAAMAARQEVERLSRRPVLLDRLMRDAQAEHSRAGPQAVAADAENRRRDWVQARLVDHGRARAQSLGWPDVYSFTKALSERAVEELIQDGDGPGAPLSIVRPSIIESALRQPYPGWIEGFKMLDPIFLAYGRGVLREFPGIPEGVVDIIPVDLVANALIAVAANPPEPRVPRYYHVSSGARNPITFQELYGHVRDYFTEHPLPEAGRGTIKVPEWQFPGRARVERMLASAERAADVADRAIRRLPRSDRTRSLVTKLHRGRRQLDFARRYADLYGAYAEAEVVYTDHAVRELWERVPPDEGEPFGFDAAAIDWSHYVTAVHLPAVTAGMRSIGSRRPPRRSAIPTTSQTAAAAVFDLEGTLVDSNVVEAFVWLRLADLPTSAWPQELLAVARALPRYIATDRKDRAAFLRAFYRRYEGATVEGLAHLVEEHAAELMLSRLVPAAIRRVREHRAAGHRTVLITGALEPLVAPLAPLFDTVRATQLHAVDGVYTGYLEHAPLVGEARAIWLRDLADADGTDLAASHAYGDSHSDLPMLQVVGHPVAVNPDTALYRRARSNGWPVEEWKTSGSRPHMPFPVGAAR